MQIHSFLIIKRAGHFRPTFRCINLFAYELPEYTYVLFIVICHPYKVQLIFSPVCKLRVSFLRTATKNGYLRIILVSFYQPSERNLVQHKGNSPFNKINFKFLCPVRRHPLGQQSYRLLDL